MPESDSDRDIFEEAREAVEQARRRADRDAHAPDAPAEQLPNLESLRELYERNPYSVLAAAAGAGYILGGGLLTPFTKRLTRMGMKALVIPAALSQLKSLSSEPGDGRGGGDD